MALADERADVAAARLETYLRALDAYDHDRARQGLIVALVGMGVVLLTISLAVLR